MKNYYKILIPLTAFVFTACASVQTNTKMYEPVLYNLQKGDYKEASLRIDNEIKDESYSDKDKLLLYLDKGILTHYNREFDSSNYYFDQAEFLMEDLFTKSISKGIASFLLNDNALDYSGEVYEKIYIHIFKALNYIELNNFDGAYVEVRKVNLKLRELEVKYSELYKTLNESEESKIEVQQKELNYYNNLLVNYLSYLIFLNEGELDNSRISLEQLYQSWKDHPEVYYFDLPEFLSDSTVYDRNFINIIAFTGIAPHKIPIGARITTFDDYLIVSDPTDFYIQPIIFPGIEYGSNYKFEFPSLLLNPTFVNRIDVYIDEKKVGNLHLLEDMNKVAEKTFEQNKNLIYFKTIIRALSKGITGNVIGNEIKKEADGVTGDIAKTLINLLFDVSEQADLRSWRTMPGYFFAGKFPITNDRMNISVKYYDSYGNLLYEEFFKNYTLKRKINLLRSIYLN